MIENYVYHAAFSTIELMLFEIQNFINNAAVVSLDNNLARKLYFGCSMQHVKLQTKP